MPSVWNSDQVIGRSVEPQFHHNLRPDCNICVSYSNTASYARAANGSHPGSWWWWMWRFDSTWWWWDILLWFQCTQVGSSAQVLYVAFNAFWKRSGYTRFLHPSDSSAHVIASNAFGWQNMCKVQEVRSCRCEAALHKWDHVLWLHWINYNLHMQQRCVMHVVLHSVEDALCDEDNCTPMDPPHPKDALDHCGFFLKIKIYMCLLLNGLAPGMDGAQHKLPTALVDRIDCIMHFSCPGHGARFSPECKCCQVLNYLSGQVLNATQLPYCWNDYCSERSQGNLTHLEYGQHFEALQSCLAIWQTDKWWSNLWKIWMLVIVMECSVLSLTSKRTCMHLCTCTHAHTHTPTLYCTPPHTYTHVHIVKQEWHGHRMHYVCVYVYDCILFKLYGNHLVLWWCVMEC